MFSSCSWDYLFQLGITIRSAIVKDGAILNGNIPGASAAGSSYAAVEDTATEWAFMDRVGIVSSLRQNPLIYHIYPNY